MAKKAPAKTPAKKAETRATPSADNIELLESVPLTLTAELGRTSATMETVHEWGDQSLVELEKTVGQPIDIFLNGELFGRGEVVTVGQNFGVRIIDIVEPD